MKDRKSQYRLCRDLFERTGNPYYFMLANCYKDLADEIVKLDKLERIEDEFTL